MSRAPGQQQPSIRSFFQPRQLPKFAAPPTTSTTTPPPPPTTTTTNPPPAPPLPPPTATAPLPPPTLPLLPPPPSLPPQASILPITATHVPPLRRINSLLLSVPYPDSFYASLLDPSSSGLLSRAILWRDTPASSPKVIGGIVCRLEPTAPGTPGTQAIYLQSLALLSPYRAQGLAAAALEHIIASAVLLPQASWDVRSVYAHVWTENEDGLRWYAARGFEREGSEPVKGYYYKLRPDTAWIVRRRVGEGAPPPVPGATQSTQGVRSGGGVVAAAVNLPPIGSGGGGPPRRPSAAPSPSGSTLSFQNARPETEWNDLPEEMVKGSGGGGGGGGAGASRSQLVPPPPTSGPGSATSSRSSSAARKKKERAYPTAAFGN